MAQDTRSVTAALHREPRQPMDEETVRRIVREELDAWMKRLTAQVVRRAKPGPNDA